MLPSPSSSPQRSVFVDYTNVERDPTLSPCSPKRRIGIPTPTSHRSPKRRKAFPARQGETPSKRKRLIEKLEEVANGVDDEDEIVAGPSRLCGPRTVFRMRSSMAQGQRPIQNYAQLSTLPYLSSFVSSHKSDIFKCHSEDDIFLTVPYACNFSHASKRGTASHLAVSTEQGTVHIMDVSARKVWDPEPPRSVLRPHQNGVFDVQWSPSDARIATSSADHTAAICDPNREDAAPLRVLQGHEGTLKCLSWCNENIFATGGRDGKIRIWDLRVASPSSIMVLAEKSIPMKKLKKAKFGAAPSKSITGLLFDEDVFMHKIISSTSANGLLRGYDIRMTGDDNGRWAEMGSHISQQDPTIHSGTNRPRGLSGLSVGSGPSAGLLFALGADSNIHIYSSHSLQPLSTASTSLSHPLLKGTSFYARTSVSPCGRWLATGSAGTSGNAFMFDVSGIGSALARGEQHNRQAIHLQGHTGEVGAIDWADRVLATSADDGTVRTWRPNAEAYRQCLKAPEQARWDWCWSRHGANKARENTI